MQSTMVRSLPLNEPEVALATRPVSTYLSKGCEIERKTRILQLRLCSSLTRSQAFLQSCAAFCVPKIVETNWIDAFEPIFNRIGSQSGRCIASPVENDADVCQSVSVALVPCGFSIAHVNSHIFATNFDAINSHEFHLHIYYSMRLRFVRILCIFSTILRHKIHLFSNIIREHLCVFLPFCTGKKMKRRLGMCRAKKLL